MKTPAQRNTLPLLIMALWLIFIGLNQFSVNSRAQDKGQLPARLGFVNDFAGVLDDATKQRLEVMLENLKQRSGIEFGIATIQTTGPRDIFDVSREFATEWNLGARNSKQKSLLLVIAVNEKTAFTQFSRSVQVDLPEGVLGELSQVMRGSLSSGRFSQGVNDGVTHFIGSVARKAGFPAQDIDQAQVASATVNEPVVSASPVNAPAESPAVVIPSTSDAVAATRPRKVSNPREEVTTPENASAPPAKSNTSAKSSGSSRVNTAEDDADEAEEVELVLTLPLAERPAKLKEFMEAFPNSKSRPRAIELLISTYAALGDLKLKDGDRVVGLQQLSLTISEAPVNISDKLFANVVAQIPSNLYLRGEREAAFDAARQIEAKFGADPKRLLVLSAFYLGIEDGDEAARLASQAVKLAPEMADAHRALGLGLHLALRLDEAAVEYKRALELDRNTKQNTRRSLADLNRASGKTEAALALYREQLAAEPNDRAARAGVVLSLLELGRTEEGQKELDSALTNDPDLTLLAGAAYWFAAHDNSERALDLAQRAVQLEPRYTWAQIALARALSGQKRPLEAERAIRFAAMYGKFPTLDYELATTLAALGLYDEAADVLLHSFSYETGKISTRLAGRVLTRADSFTELLALERRASIFQFTGAERPGDAATLKALLAFVAATGDNGRVDDKRAAAAAKEFASGTDKMLAYRQIYAANRLLRLGVALPTVLELTEAARSSVDVALEVPGMTVAVQAEELRDMRMRALAQGATPDVPEAPRNVLANIMRGRVEDLTGLALFKQDKPGLSLDHFRRAVA
ncbi:MAG TPA: TPM domain-containing protein, partial [Pyrinomonadaceae bacterium]|nr:TPM domain-containing protein [Pyrinomonadaceae bacterium]